MSQHADVEAKIAAELDGLGLLASAQRPRPRSMAYEDLARLPYLSWVIKVLPRLRPACLLLCLTRHQLEELSCDHACVLGHIFVQKIIKQHLVKLLMRCSCVVCTTTLLCLQGLGVSMLPLCPSALCGNWE